MFSPLSPPPFIFLLASVPICGDKAFLRPFPSLLFSCPASRRDWRPPKVVQIVVHPRVLAETFPPPPLSFFFFFFVLAPERDRSCAGSISSTLQWRFHLAFFSSFPLREADNVENGNLVTPGGQRRVGVLRLSFSFFFFLLFKSIGISMGQ